MEGLVVVLIIVAIIATVAGLGYYQQKKRTEAWQRVAAELGLEYIAPGAGLESRFGYLRLFQQGHSRRTTGGVTGDSGDMEITVADYRYTTGHGKSAHTHAQTVCILRRPALDLPACYLRPQRRIADLLGKLFGGQDIEFADDPEFSSAYVIQGQDEAAVRALFTPQRRARFAAQRGKNFHFEAQGDTFLFHTGRRVPPEQTKELMQQAIEMLRVLA
ncbi:MAG: hypothetical protein NUV77_11925 [Thermoguttaceae bacterium]|nr:hypothetical protein [Thermoguttaceae bacterium]